MGRDGDLGLEARRDASTSRRAGRGEANEPHVDSGESRA